MGISGNPGIDGSWAAAAGGRRSARQSRRTNASVSVLRPAEKPERKLEDITPPAEFLAASLLLHLQMSNCQENKGLKCRNAIRASAVSGAVWLAARCLRFDYCWNSAGRPVKRSIRFAIGGWVEKRFPKLIPSSG